MSFTSSAVTFRTMRALASLPGSKGAIEREANLIGLLGDPLGLRQHNVMHSCVVGFAVGRLLSEPNGTELPLADFPADADCGVQLLDAQSCTSLKTIRQPSEKAFALEN
jgi:hypothetical protein